MKHLFKFLCLGAMLIMAACSDSDKIDDLQKQINDLKNTEIATVETQVKNINASISTLETMSKQLEGYLSTLNTEADKLKAADEAMQKSIDAMKSEMDKKMETMSAEKAQEMADMLAQMQAVKAEIQKQLNTINASIETLTQKDAQLEQQIADLKAYVDGQITSTKDWASATFATLEQYSTITTTIAGIKLEIEGINAAISALENKTAQDIATALDKCNTAISALENKTAQDIATALDKCNTAISALENKTAQDIAAALDKCNTAISQAIEDSETSMKAWVNEKLSAYYTIAQMDAKLEILKTAQENGDASLKADIDALDAALTQAKADITAAYGEAITAAITANNGVITQQIASDIATATNSLQTQINTINTAIEDIKTRLTAIEADLKKVLARVQSINVIPTFDDGSVEVKKSGTTDIRFEIMPRSASVALAELAKDKSPQELSDIFSIDAVETKSRAIFTNMPVKAVTDDGECLVVTVDATVLGEDFFKLKKTMSARLKIEDANNSISIASGYFNITVVPATPTTGTAKRTGNIDVKWVQLWENGPKFAEYNVGVTDGKAESCGGYYAWGGSQDKVDDHNTGSATLTGANDTATKLWGSAWRMPTKAELDDLLAKCDVEWTAVNGVNGRKFTGKGDYASNSVFLPAVGYYDSNGTVKKNNTNGYYWSSTPNNNNAAYNLEFKSTNQSVYYTYYNDNNFSVRAVLAE